MAKNKIIIIGGGASGLVAAIVAARNGAKVTILERKERIGKKILATGNGRCNLTNLKCVSDAFHGGSEEFINNILKQFNTEDTLAFFSELGIYPIELENGKIYPNSLQAGSIVDVLRMEIDRLKIKLECNEEVMEIEQKNNFVVHTKNDNKYYGNRIIISTGGKSSPDLGSNGSGFTLAKSLGHKIVKPIPSLVQMKSNAGFLKQLKGVKVNGLAKIIEDNKILREEYGEILFTDYGISGPPILQLSRIASTLIHDNINVTVDIDFFRDMTNEQLDKMLMDRLTSMSNRTIQDNFIGLINKRLINVIIKVSGIQLNKKSGDITREERARLVNSLKKFTLNITGTNQWNQSQVTAGGISTSEIDNHTLESKLVENIFLAGEIIDVDGDCGGYNLQWAWSTGFIAGMNASK
ncbi:flavoprotein [Vallitalea longa]|uniref:Flavoprotein n=1 Tax=Vallitalea longa TaxID=2936439 RepID=A0A9W5YCG7_9FIRM|nr:NAD(P)/FAD-dependent oxidoreductase [Vallitalea longa]GKX30065.1 flavoprotein [Vallitalea longa]